MAGRDCGSARAERTLGDPLEEITGRELLAALDEEIAALPEKYRAPLLLFYLEGRTQEETARQLRTSLSTVRRNLERGCNLLRARLTRRGLSLAASLGLILLARQSATAVPVALALTAGRGSVGVTARSLELAATLSRGALPRALKAALALVLVLGTVVSGVVVMNRSAGAGHEDGPPVAAGDPRQAAAAPEKPATDTLGDPLPPGVLHRLGTVRLRHRNALRSIAYSPDGKMLVSAGWDATIHLWDPTSGKELRHIDGPEKGVDAIAVAPDGKKLAGAGIDGTVYVWDSATGKEIRRLEGRKPSLHCVAFSPGSDLIAAGGEGAAFRVWDVESGKVVHELTGPDNVVLGLTFASDGKTLAAAGGGNTTVHVWSMTTGKEIHRLKGHGGRANAVVFSPDGQNIVTGGDDSDDKEVWIWDVNTGKEIERLKGHHGGVRAVAFSPDGKTLATGGGDHTLRLWDWATRKESRVTRAHADGLSTIAFSPDGKTVATGCAESAIHLWDVSTGKSREIGLGHQERIRSVSVAPDGRTIATAAWDGTVRLWDAATGKERGRLETVDPKESREYPNSPEHLVQVLFAPDGKRIVTVREDEVVVAWDASSGKELYRLRGNCVAFAPDGKQVAVGGRGATIADSNSGVIRLLEADTGKELRQFRGHKTVLAAITFSADGKTLVSCGVVLFGMRTGEPGESETKFLRVWDVAKGEEIPGFPPMRANCVTLSSDGRTLATTAFLGKSIPLLEMATKSQRAELKGHTDMIFAITFAPDGRTLASASMDGTVRLWDLPSGKEIGRLEGHHGWVMALAFSPDGKALVSGSTDTSALVWDMAPFHKKRAAGPDLTPKQLDAHWQSLSEGAAPAHAALAALVASPKQSVPFLRERLEPAVPADPKQVARLIADLDNESFEMRDKAAVELEKIGELAEPALRKALKANPTAEARQRLETLLEKSSASAPSGAQTRRVRAVEALEQMDTAEARQFLEALAKGAPEARLTQEAKAALGRLKNP
jgi:WD40 repeat protein